jgi:MoaA/NifB/PqqE/SkfB family radical SAM enzyme
MIIVWRLTTRCNLSCPFCAYDRMRPFARSDAAPADLRDFCRALADYQRTHADPVLVSWLGGEPFLYPGFASLAAATTALGLRVSATTNGTALHSAAVRHLILDHFAELTVSLDAPGALHDTLRGWPGAFAALRRDVTALAAARVSLGRTLKLRVNTVLLRATIDALPALAREVADWGVDELTFNLLGGRDRPEYFAAHRPLPGQVAALAAALPALRAELAPRGLTLAGGPAYLRRLHAAATDQVVPVTDCAPGERFLFVDENGVVSPCSFTSDELGVPAADLRDAAGIAALPARFAAARFAHAPAACADCPSTQVSGKFSHAA